MSTATKQQTIANAAKFAETVDEGTPIDTLSALENLQVSESSLFTKLTPILGNREVTNWAFDNDMGAVLRKDIEGQGIVVAQITDKRESGLVSFEDMKDRLVRIVSQKKKLDKIKELADRVASTCKQAGALEAYTQVDSTLELRSHTSLVDNGQLQGYGGEFAATSAAFTAPINQITDPIRGNRAWFVMEVDARNDADMNEFETNKLSVMQNAASRTRSSAYYTWFRQYKENADIEDLRGQNN